MQKPNIPADGKIHRIKGKSGKSAWAVSNGTYGAYGDWRTGEKYTFKEEGKYNFKEAMMQRAQSEQTKYQRQKEASQLAEMTWGRLPNSYEPTRYLLAKGIDNFGCKILYDLVYVPLRDTNGKLWSVQTINSDGKKSFLKDGRKKGCFHQIGESDKPVIFCEGYATGASIAMASAHELCIVVCFDAYNLTAVIKEWRHKQGMKRKFYIAADNDKWKPEVGNVGMAEACYCGEKYNCKVISPRFKNEDTFPTDFNDLHVLEGLGAVQDQIMGALNNP